MWWFLFAFCSVAALTTSSTFRHFFYRLALLSVLMLLVMVMGRYLGGFWLASG